MMVPVATIIEAVTVIFLLTAIQRNRRRLQWIAKPAASAVFLAVGLMRWSPNSAFDTWMVLGLALGLAGDVLLIEERTFLLGLFVFLAGHGAFVAAFNVALGFIHWPIWILAPLGLAAVLAVAWLRPHAGRMLGPVLAYIGIITLMSWGGLSVWATGVLPMTAAIGASLFFLSDLAVARHRFIKAEFLNRVLVLPTYYAAQLLFAFTVGTVG
ncbi:MAG: lysoplasmalogenase [Thermoanaerobaculales bacterium]|nr:lysoplasmalogenase [Thermoanaerobaculales bacterium]